MKTEKVHQAPVSIETTGKPINWSRFGYIGFDVPDFVDFPVIKVRPIKR